MTRVLELASRHKGQMEKKVLTTCPKCQGFLDIHDCALPLSCGLLTCRSCGSVVNELTGKALPADPRKVPV